MDALCEQQAGAGVAQVVEAHGRQARGREVPMERVQDIGVVERRPDLGREHQVPGSLHDKRLWRNIWAHLTSYPRTRGF
jgi:hypothetical protein